MEERSRLRLKISLVQNAKALSSISRHDAYSTRLSKSVTTKTTLIRLELHTSCWIANVLRVNQNNEDSAQWRIQDFQEKWAPTVKVGAPTYYFVQFSSQTGCMKMKKIDPEGACIQAPRIRQCNVSSYLCILWNEISCKFGIFSRTMR